MLKSNFTSSKGTRFVFVFGFCCYSNEHGEKEPSLATTYVLANLFSRFINAGNHTLRNLERKQIWNPVTHTFTHTHIRIYITVMESYDQVIYE